MRTQRILLGLSLFDFLSGILAILCMYAFTSCDDHTPIDNGIHPGYLLLSDHSVVSDYTFSSLPDDSRSPVVGVVFATATASHPALAVILTEFEGKYCDTLVSCGASTSDTLFNGRVNTISMMEAKADSLTDICPLAVLAQSSHKDGQSDFIPSVAEMRLLCSAAPVVNPMIVKYGGTPVCDDPASDCWYWTSTESASSQKRFSWLCSSVNGGILETVKTERHKARVIVELNY